MFAYLVLFSMTDFKNTYFVLTATTINVCKTVIPIITTGGNQPIIKIPSVSLNASIYLFISKICFTKNFKYFTDNVNILHIFLHI